MESREENTSWYLTVNGSRVEVTEEVYRAYRFENNRVHKLAWHERRCAQPNFAHCNGDCLSCSWHGFHCFHNSCAGYHWHEFREKVDPSAYANSPYTVHQAVSTGAPSRSQPDGAEGSATAVKTGQPRMLDFAEIPNYDRSKIVVIRSRFQALDAKIGGFNKGEMTVWSGGNASGKSTLVSQIGLAAITEGFKVAMFSGEMTASRVREWVLLQAAGPDFVMQDPLNQNHYCLKPGIEEKLDAMLTGKLSIYDNDFGTDWEVVTNTIYDWVKKNEASVVIIDNLMALDIPTGSMDKYDMQTRIVKRFSAMAKELNVHVHFICHPRKTEPLASKDEGADIFLGNPQNFQPIIINAQTGAVHDNQSTDYSLAVAPMIIR